MLIQADYKRPELQRLITNTISYVKISHSHLSSLTIREYLTSLLSKVIYSQYLNRQSRWGNREKVAGTTISPYTREHEHPSTAVEEVIQVLRNGWADLGDTWSDDHPDMKIREEVRELLIVVQQYELLNEKSPTTKIREDVSELFLVVKNQADQLVRQTRDLLLLS